MASNSKEDIPTDEQTKAVGQTQLCFSTFDSAAGLRSGGESSRSSSSEDLRGAGEKDVCRSQADAVEFCAALGRPDRVTIIRQIVGTSLEDFVVRASATANHVLVMGSPSMLFHPLQCPFREKRCRSFRAYSPQDLKEHLEARHELDNVQVNLACPCPAVCNVVDGQQRACHTVEYDPMDGVLESHISEKHPTYFETMGDYLIMRNAGAANLQHIPEQVKNFEQYLEKKKNLPAWTRMDPLHSPLFPSQVFPEKVILETIIKDEKNMLYTCPIPPCRGAQEMDRIAMSEHFLKEPGHEERMGPGARIVQRCPKCDVCMHWCSEKMMLLHVRAMHPEVLDKSSNLTEAAKTELGRLVGQIKGKVIGRAVGETTRPGDDSDGTQAHYLYSFRCHMQNCEEIFSERDHLEWHITADHQSEWNSSGTSG